MTSKTNYRGQGRTLCLNMIVKNESAIIRNCLESIAPWLDYWCIHDTGSTDNTVQIIETFFRERGIPGEMHHTPWKNFGYNRTKRDLDPTRAIPDKKPSPLVRII